MVGSKDSPQVGQQRPVQGRSFEVEAASAGLIEVAGLEAVGPVTFVILGGEVARTGAGDKRLPGQ